MATYRAACERWPGTVITLRQGARVVEDNRRTHVASLPDEGRQRAVKREAEEQGGGNGGAKGSSPATEGARARGSGACRSAQAHSLRPFEQQREVVLTWVKGAK
jgi:hypothetical protein